MALVATKCTACGANIKIDNSKEMAVCQHCGTTFVTQKETKNTSVNYNVTNLFTDVKEDANDLFKNGIALYQLGEFEQAYKFLKKARELAPSSYRAWYYSALCVFEHMKTMTDCGDDFDEHEEEMTKSIGYAVRLARTPEQKKEIKAGVLETLEFSSAHSKKEEAKLLEWIELLKVKNAKNRAVAEKEKENIGAKKAKTRAYSLTKFALIGAGILFVALNLFIPGIVCFCISPLFFYLQWKEECKEKKRDAVNMKMAYYSKEQKELQKNQDMLAEMIKMGKGMEDFIEEVKNW